MTRISKKNLPVFMHTARKKQKHVVLIWKKNTAILSVIIILSLLFCLCEKLGERIGTYLNDHSRETISSTSSFLPTISLPKSSIYDSQFAYDANEDVHSALRNTEDIGNSFIQQRPEIGKLSQIKWKEDDSIVTPNVRFFEDHLCVTLTHTNYVPFDLTKHYTVTSLFFYLWQAHRILLPAKLTRALKKYCLDIGLTDLARNFILSEENNIEPDGFRLVTLGDGNVWYAQRPAKKWQSDMHWISPADEKGHESYLKLLNENGFLSVLNVIGNELGLAGLVAYQLTFIVVSHCEQGFIHHDTHDTGDRTFNVIIPLETVDDSPPELIIQGTDFPV